ncbi:hypothetical protein BDV97DRAFT_365815 [Delphinella strobiligena]|nr:hypothetical protein BDV97DRAFT_365815 [Delphinella strobiligena]
MVSRLWLDPATVQRVWDVLRAERSRPSSDGLTPPEIVSTPLENEVITLPNGKIVSARHRVVLNDDYPKHAMRLCRKLLSLLQEPENIHKIDDELSLLLECDFKRVEDPEDVVSSTCRVLQRLPSHPPPMKDHTGTNIYLGMSQAYLVNREKGATWDNLKASTFLDRNVIRIAIHQATLPHRWSHHTLNYVNNIARLLEASDILSKEEIDDRVQRRWFMIKTFLWTTWHRSVILHFSYELNTQLNPSLTLAAGHPPELALEGPVPVRLSSTLGPTRSFEKTQLISRLTQKMDIPDYMCRWAYELCRTDRASLTQDFRVLCERYANFSRQLAPDISRPRCLIAKDGIGRQCDGTSPHACHRFASDKTASEFTKSTDQSAHTLSCSRTDSPCFPMFWNEDTYRSLTGARAVSISTNQEYSSVIPYCVASRHTMAISHVWSHGQGGRPGTGFNNCLHRRYCNIARRYGCDSYWMDTPCIPEDHDLRDEAITHINSVFRNSRLTLICDRDIMEVDIGGASPAIDVKETILSILLVCDWNVRAWTFLEAIRGRGNQHLLCKNDETISLSSLINSVNQEGSMELASIFLTSDHLTVWDSTFPNSDEDTQPRPPMVFLEPEESACLLSRRYATRPGDDVTIWSLLCGDQVYKSAEKFWKSRFSCFVRSAPPGVSKTQLGSLQSWTVVSRYVP